MTTYCTYCQKEVVEGEDASLRANGYLKSCHKSCHREMTALQREYAYLILGNTCKCCGSTENIQAGHINFPKDKIRKNRNTRFGVCCTTGDEIGNAGFLKLIETRAVIPICAPCNRSMGSGSTCRIHRKYLGIWNYLPKLHDLEAGMVS